MRNIIVIFYSLGLTLMLVSSGFLFYTFYTILTCGNVCYAETNIYMVYLELFLSLYGLLFSVYFYIKIIREIKRGRKYEYKT